MREKKKTSEEVIRARKRHISIQKNRDQLKLLKEGKVLEVELLAFDPDLLTFRKVSIISKEPVNGDKIVYLSNNGKRHKLKIGTYIEKDAGGSCKINNVGFIKWKHCFGVIINE